MFRIIIIWSHSDHWWVEKRSAPGGFRRPIGTVGANSNAQLNYRNDRKGIPTNCPPLENWLEKCHTAFPSSNRLPLHRLADGFVHQALGIGTGNRIQFFNRRLNLVLCARRDQLL